MGKSLNGFARVAYPTRAVVAKLYRKLLPQSLLITASPLLCRSVNLDVSSPEPQRLLAARQPLARIQRCRDVACTGSARRRGRSLPAEMER